MTESKSIMNPGYDRGDLTAKGHKQTPRLKSYIWLYTISRIHQTLKINFTACNVYINKVGQKQFRK